MKALWVVILQDVQDRANKGQALRRRTNGERKVACITAQVNERSAG